MIYDSTIYDSTVIYDSMILYDRYMIAPDELASPVFLCVFLLLLFVFCYLIKTIECLLTCEFFTDAVIYLLIIVDVQNQHILSLSLSLSLSRLQSL